MDADSIDAAVMLTEGELEQDLAIRPAALPSGRLGVEHYFVQPIEVLNAAWDDYMDRTAAESMMGSQRPQGERLPTLMDLSRGELTTVHLSLLFDCAISAYRRSEKVQEK